VIWLMNPLSDPNFQKTQPLLNWSSCEQKVR
jgi:hypothetical protein